jgi:hypothetical protein
VFFNETINCERYVKVILRIFFEGLTEEEKLHGWFRQESVTAHTVHFSMQLWLTSFGRESSAAVSDKHIHLN